MRARGQAHEAMGAIARCVFLIALTTFASAPAARAQEPLPDATMLLEKMRAAAAGPPAFHETTRTTISNGVTVTTVRAQRGDDWRDTEDRGPFHREAGRFKGHAWHQNDNGQTVNDEPDPGQATPDPITTTVTRVTTPVNAYLLSQLNSRGAGIRRYIDPSTWLVVRLERLAANGNSITTYDDFRTDGGHLFAHHLLTKNDMARTTTDAQVIAYDTAPVSDSEVAIRESTRQLVEFPAGVRSVDLPTQFGSGHIFVHATIDGRGLDFILDSGASGITLDNGVARQLGLPEIGAQSTVTAQRYTTARTIVPEMHVGPLVMHDVAVQIVPLGQQEIAGTKGVGLLGFDFLAQLGVTIDYERHRVSVVPEADYTIPADAHAIPLDVRIGSGVPLVNIKINGALGERFIIDTGGAGTLMIFDAFVRKHGDILIDQGGGIGRNRNFAGVGGSFSTRPAQLNAISVGSINLAGFVAYIVTSKESYAGNNDGLLGSEFLQNYTLGLDYMNSRVYLVPNAQGRSAMGIR